MHTYIFHRVNVVPNEALVNTVRPITDRNNITYILQLYKSKWNVLITNIRHTIYSHHMLLVYSCITHKNTISVNTLSCASIK